MADREIRYKLTAEDDTGAAFASVDKRMAAEQSKRMADFEKTAAERVRMRRAAEAEAERDLIDEAGRGERGRSSQSGTWLDGSGIKGGAGGAGGGVAEGLLKIGGIALTAKLAASSLLHLSEFALEASHSTMKFRDFTEIAISGWAKTIPIIGDVGTAMENFGEIISHTKQNLDKMNADADERDTRRMNFRASVESFHRARKDADNAAHAGDALGSVGEQFHFADQQKDKTDLVNKAHQALLNSLQNDFNDGVIREDVRQKNYLQIQEDYSKQLFDIKLDGLKHEKDIAKKNRQDAGGLAGIAAGIGDGGNSAVAERVRKAQIDSQLNASLNQVRDLGGDNRLEDVLKNKAALDKANAPRDGSPLQLAGASTLSNSFTGVSTKVREEANIQNLMLSSDKKREELAERAVKLLEELVKRANPDTPDADQIP